MKNQWFILILASLFFVGCTEKIVNLSNLNSAKLAYEDLKKDEKINNFAPAELFQAGKIYALGKNAKSQEEVNHITYILLAQIEIAKESAKTKSLLEKVESLKSAKAQAILDEKESRLFLLQKEAEKAKLEAKASQEKFEALQKLNVQNRSIGLVLTLEDSLFESEKSNLLPSSTHIIEKLAEFLFDYEERLILIEGYTDNVESPTSNLDFSLRRAGVIEQALIVSGIDAKRLFVNGYGEAHPIQSNDNPYGREKNRRIEIVILKEGVDPTKMRGERLE